MFHKPVPGLVGIAVLLACAARAPAQDFRVYTKIYDARVLPLPAGTNARPQPLGRSTSLFHAGKVYDYLDTGNQMTIFEPAHGQFIIVDGSRRILTVIPFEYVENRVFQAGRSTEKKIAELREKNTIDARQLAGVLQFQLKPTFQETYDEKQLLLALKSPVLSYEVKCAPHDSPEVVEAYMNFTDSMAQLNYLVNDRALPPAPRLELDRALRRRGLLPIEVTLHASHEKGLHLRAEHRFDWKLDATDRRMISHWEKLISSSDVKRVSPRQFFEPDRSEKLDARR